jgi:predicted AlkP superfamily pyrophosphatase or phosphodiesterase
MRYRGLLFLSLTCLAAALPAAEPPPPPRLAVVISVDQMRADYLERFRPYFVEGGFKRFLDHGAWFQNCHYQHAVTKTAPGHATILSGVHANVHGIVANEWLDRTTFTWGNNVEDQDAPLVGLPPRLGRYANASFAAKAGRSPRNFLGVTVGDRLKAKYGVAAKVFGVADKDRAAILMSGPKADGAYWTEEGRFVTSTYYRPALPDWLEQFNNERNAAAFFGRTWDRLLAAEIYDRVQGPDNSPGERDEDGLGITFPRVVNGGKDTISGAYFEAFNHAPWNNELVEEMAERLVEQEQLGADGTPDLLCVGFSQTDRAGHAYGPDSHEVMDSYLRLDRTIAELFRFLDEKVGAGNWVVALTADHGAAPLVERTQRERGPAAAGRLGGASVDKLLFPALDAAYGALPENVYWALRDNSGYHVNPAALAAKQLTATEVAAKIRDIILQHPMIAAAYTREQLTGAAPLDTFGEMERLSFHAGRSTDVVYIPKPYFVESPNGGTTHGTPYEYDTHVPQVWYGAGVKPGVHTERVAVEDLAPTLARLLGVQLPPEAKGKVLLGGR